MLQLIKKALCRTCYCYTALTLSYMLILLAFLGSESSFGPSQLTIFLFFPLAFCFSLAHVIMNKKGANGIFIHAFLCFVGFFFLFYLPHAGNLKGTTHIIVAVVYLVVYSIVMLFYTSALRRRLHKEEKNTEYVSVYRTIDKK